MVENKSEFHVVTFLNMFSPTEPTSVVHAKSFQLSLSTDKMAKTPSQAETLRVVTKSDEDHITKIL